MEKANSETEGKGGRGKGRRPKMRTSQVDEKTIARKSCIKRGAFSCCRKAKMGHHGLEVERGHDVERVVEGGQVSAALSGQKSASSSSRTWSIFCDHS